MEIIKINSIEYKKSPNGVFLIKDNEADKLLIKNDRIKEVTRSNPRFFEFLNIEEIVTFYINSEKIKRDLNFSPIFGVEDAIRDLCEAFKNGKVLNSFDDDIFFNIRTMKKFQSDHA